MAAGEVGVGMRIVLCLYANFYLKYLPVDIFLLLLVVYQKTGRASRPNFTTVLVDL